MMKSKKLVTDVLIFLQMELVQFRTIFQELWASFLLYKIRSIARSIFKCFAGQILLE